MIGIYPQRRPAHVVIVVEVEHQPSVLEMTSAFFITQVECLRVEASFKQLAPGHRHGSGTAGTSEGEVCEGEEEEKKEVLILLHYYY